MNLNEERSYQMMISTLDAVGLTEANRELAEEYLNMIQEENQELLTKTEPQNFSKLSYEKKSKCKDYINYCNKRNQKELCKRFVRFLASVGGATAHDLLLYNVWNMDHIKGFLTKEQEIAMRAEGMAWNTYGLQNSPHKIEETNPAVLRSAMELCYNKDDNAKVLLAAISLYRTKQVPDEESQKTIDFLIDDLIESIPNLFTRTNPTESEIKSFQSFVRESKNEEAFPLELLTFMKGKTTDEYLVWLLAGSAFLAIEHSDRFTAFLRLLAAMDSVQNTMYTMKACVKIGRGSWFRDHFEALEAVLPIPKKTFVLWYIDEQLNYQIRHAIKTYPDVVRQVASEISIEKYQSLMVNIKNKDLNLYQEICKANAGIIQERYAKELTESYGDGRDEAIQYLLGEAELATLYPFVDKWSNEWEYYNGKHELIKQLQNNEEEQRMYRRAVVLEALHIWTRYFRFYWYGQGRSHRNLEEKAITEILSLFEEEKLPIRYQLETLSGIFNNIYETKDQLDFMDECIKSVTLFLKKKEWQEEIPKLAKEGGAVTRILCVRAMNSFWEDYKDVLLSCAADTSKQMKEWLVTIYESHKEWENDIKDLLNSKKSQEREVAILVMKKWGVASYQTEFEAALAKEKSKKIKELLQNCLGVKAEGGIQTEQTIDQLVKDILKGGRKKKVSWVWEKPLSQVHKLDGTLASEDYLSAILISYADMHELGVNANAAKLAKELNPEELSNFVAMVFSKWLEDYAEAKKKWVLYAASIHGGEPIIPVLHTQIQEWPKAARGAMASEAVKALSLNGSPTALLLVDQISRKFKYRQIKAAAAEALDYAAKELGITRAELEDRIVPNLDFDENMERTFDYGTRSFKVLLTTALELEVYDENGKKLKNMPSVGKKDDKEKAKAANDAFKLLKKQLKTVVTNQKLRLDQAMSTERLWPVKQWKELFVKNPVMHQFAMGLIWGIYEKKELKATFRYMEDGTFNNVDEEEYELPESGMIGLVHPIELDQETLSAWKEQLSDYEVIQPIEQIERPVYEVAAEEMEEVELTRFGGKVMNGASLSGKLQGMGWYRGSVQDAGGYYTFYREDGEIGVELEFSGCSIGYEFEDITVYGAQFYRAGTVQRGSYVYDTVKEEDQYMLGEINPRYFSEIVLQLTKATASSQEQVAYPECKRYQ